MRIVEVEIATDTNTVSERARDGCVPAMTSVPV